MKKGARSLSLNIFVEDKKGKKYNKIKPLNPITGSDALPIQRKIFVLTDLSLAGSDSTLGMFYHQVTRWYIYR
jgi:hypothetical protein